MRDGRPGGGDSPRVHPAEEDADSAVIHRGRTGGHGRSREGDNADPVSSQAGEKPFYFPLGPLQPVRRETFKVGTTKKVRQNPQCMLYEDDIKTLMRDEVATIVTYKGKQLRICLCEELED